MEASQQESSKPAARQPWRTDQPPNETTVEVELNERVLQVMAYFGRDGNIPHWRTPDGTHSFPVGRFARWRHVG